VVLQQALEIVLQHKDIHIYCYDFFLNAVGLWLTTQPNFLDQMAFLTDVDDVWHVFQDFLNNKKRRNATKPGFQHFNQVHVLKWQK